MIFDRVLLHGNSFQNFISQFSESYSVQSGETLKDLDHLNSHLKEILERTNRLEERPLQILAIGGGSVGDFAGFVASTLKRGVGLIHMPSTWLAAVDSAHGGKTALNVGGIKNQIGTFYPAEKVYLIQNLLMGQGEQQIDDVLGEALKTSLLSGGPLFQKILKLKKWGPDELWSLLPTLIKVKYNIVKKDPFERKGIRHLLNLGHTIGHVFETELGISHGKAVLAGLGFSLQWSRKKNILSGKQLTALKQSFLFSKIPMNENQAQMLSQVGNFQKHLSQDKKRTGGKKVRFVFVRSAGKPIIQSVKIQEIENEIERQSR